MVTISGHDAVVRCGRAILVAVAVLASVTVGLPTIANAGVADFTFSSYDADYLLTRDNAQHSHLAVIERLTAVFPAGDQNHGIERAIPDTYDGHPVDVVIISITDGNGTPLRYTTSDTGGDTVVRIGDPGRFVHGVTQYVLQYTMRDVTKGASKQDELYWYTNGFAWPQSFAAVTARLHLDGAVAAAYVGRRACFQGTSGSTEPCAVTETTAGGELVLTFRATRTLAGHENLTMAAAFRAGTFAGYTAPPDDPAVAIVFAVWGGLNVAIAVIGALLLVRLRRRLTGRTYDRRKIAPTGAPPTGLGVLQAAALLRRPSAAVAAQVLDLAVRGYLRITELSPEGELPPGFELCLLHTVKDLRPKERRLLRILFGGSPKPGATVRVDLLDYEAQIGLRMLVDDTDRELVDLGLVTLPTRWHNRYYRLGWLFAGLGVVLLLPALIVLGPVLCRVARDFRPVTAAGAAWLDQLLGVRAYLEMTRERDYRSTPTVVGPDGRQTAQPQRGQYEALLPYAVLFGFESQWLTMLPPWHQRSPAWYRSSGDSFSPVLFSSVVTDVSGPAVSPSPPISVGPYVGDASGGGNWGGFSGDGGGGGGGTGW